MSNVRALNTAHHMQAPSVRAAGIALRGNQVLLHRRFADSVWALPGGRVDPGESAAQALVREFQEELGCTVRCGELVYVAENFFPHAGASIHEVGLYFRVVLEVASVPSHALSSFRGAEAELEFQWFERNSLSRINLRPLFLVASLALEQLEFKHVVEHEPAGL